MLPKGSTLPKWGPQIFETGSRKIINFDIIDAH
jgi:hypothetical protein